MGEFGRLHFGDSAQGAVVENHEGRDTLFAGFGQTPVAQPVKSLLAG